MENGKCGRYAAIMSDSLESPSASSPINLPRLIAIGVLLLLAARAAVVPLFIWDMLHYPIDYFFGEGDMLFYAQRVLHGKTIYTDSTSYPLIGNVYPPLYPWILSIVGRVVPLTLASARALQIVPLTGIMLIVVVWARREAVPLAVACAGALLVPCCYQFGEYILAPRPDSWMLLFLLAAFYFLSAFEPREDSAELTRGAAIRPLLLGALFSTLALYAKHSALAPLAALQLHLLIRRPRQGLMLIGATIGFCALLLALTLGMYGSVFFTSMLSPQAPRHLEIARLWGFLLPALKLIAVIGVVGLCGLIQSLGQRRWTLLHSFVLGSLPLAIVVLIDGGGPNHLLPLVAALLLAAVRAARDLLKITRFANAPAIGLAIAVVLQLWLLHSASGQGSANPLAAPNEREFAEAAVVAQFLAQESEPVYAEREWGVVADRDCADRFFIEPIHLRFLKAGTLPEAAVLQPFREQVFSHVLLFELNFQPAFIRKEIEKYYEPFRPHPHGYIKVCAGTAGDTPVLFLVRRPLAPQPPLIRD